MAAAILDPADPRHGTYRGARAHRRADDELCEPCGAAMKAYNREQGRRRHRATGRPPGAPSILAKAAAEDVDEVVVERHMASEPCPANAAERIEIVRRWTADQRSIRALELLVNWNVYRYVRVLKQVA